jgi:hypothetical protein
VLPRPAPRVSFRFGVLDLSGTSLSPAEVAAVIATGAYVSAIRLVLGRNRLGDAGVARLAACGQLPALTELDLDGAGITDAGAHALATTAVGLDHVAHLALGEVPAPATASARKTTPASASAAVDALARSPRLRAALDHPHHLPARRRRRDARDDREVTPIRRADGARQPIILHGLWPTPQRPRSWPDHEPAGGVHPCTRPQRTSSAMRSASSGVARTTRPGRPTQLPRSFPRKIAPASPK